MAQFCPATTKLMHATRGLARLHLVGLKRNAGRRRNRPGWFGEAYRCAYCGQWHVGHRVKHKKRKHKANNVN